MIYLKRNIYHGLLVLALTLCSAGILGGCSVTVDDKGAATEQRETYIGESKESEEGFAAEERIDAEISKDADETRELSLIASLPDEEVFLYAQGNGNVFLRSGNEMHSLQGIEWSGDADAVLYSGNYDNDPDREYALLEKRVFYGMNRDKLYMINQEMIQEVDLYDEQNYRKIMSCIPKSAYLGDCEISLSNDCVKFNYEVCESTKNDNKNVIVGNATVYLIDHSSMLSNPDLDKMWEIDTISYRKNITEKEMKTSSLKELASIPEEQITFSIRMIDDTPYMGLLRDGENEYDVDYTMNPNATGYTLYSGDFDEDGKKEYGLVETRISGGKKQDWLSVLKIRPDNSVQVQTLDLFYAPYYDDWNGETYENYDIREIKIYRTDYTRHYAFECRIELCDPKDRKPNQNLYIQIHYGLGQTASLNYRGTVFFYCHKAIVRECSTVDEMKCLKKHTKIKKDQYAEIQKLTSFPKEQISFYGLDMEKEDLLYIQIKNDLYVVDIPWEACVETEIVSGDYDHDGEKEIAVIVGSETLYIIEKGKRIKINKCPSIRQLDVPMVREYVKKENLNMSDELSYMANGDKLFYNFYVYSGEYGDLTYHGYYTNELIYYDDGKFDYSQKESDGYFDLGTG